MLNDPTNFVDEGGLYAACIHEAMTKFLAKLAGLSDDTATTLGAFAGDKPGGADSSKYSATNPVNAIKGIFGRGPSAEIHFASEATLRSHKASFGGYMALETSEGYQQAAFVLHSIEDVHGAHEGFSLPFGHAFKGNKPDLLIGDAKFMRASNEVFHLLSADKTAVLTASQFEELIKAIIAGCGEKAKDIRLAQTAPIVTTNIPSSMNPGLLMYKSGSSGLDWLQWLYERELQRLRDKPPEPE